MSNEDRHGWASGSAVNQFGTPVNRFGTPAGQFGGPPQAEVPQRTPQADDRHGGSLGGSFGGGPINQFGAPATFGTSEPQRWSPPAQRRSAGPWLAALVALVVLAAAGVVVRLYVFPDLGKPIELPGAVAGVTSMGTAGQPVTMQSKDPKGRATAVGVYADDPATPLTMVVVTAGRVKDLGTQQITETTTTTGKVTCTDNVATGTLLAQAGATAGAGRAAMRGLTTGSACWRTGRHLTVLVVALTAHEAAQTTARQAVQEAWDAI